MVFPERSVGNIMIFMPEGKLLNTMDYDVFRQRVHHLIKSGTRGVVFDMEKVNLVNSSGISMLIAGLKILREVGGDLRLTNLSPPARKVIVSVCGLGQVFRIFNSVDEAITSFNDT